MIRILFTNDYSPVPTSLDPNDTEIVPTILEAPASVLKLKLPHTQLLADCEKN